MARVLPPRRPMTPQNSSTGSSGSLSRPVRALKTTRSSSVSSSPTIAIRRTRQGGPASARKQRSEIGGALQSLAHGDELAEPHSAASRVGGRLKWATKGLSFGAERLRRRRDSVRDKAFATRVICSSSTVLAADHGALKLFGLDGQRRGLTNQRPLDFRQTGRPAAIVRERKAQVAIARAPRSSGHRCLPKAPCHWLRESEPSACGRNSPGFPRANGRFARHD